MLKSKILALAILAASSVSFAGPISEPTTRVDISPRTVMRTAVAESTGLRASLRTKGVEESIADRVAAAGVTWDAKSVETIERMSPAQLDIFKISAANALVTIESARTAGALSQEGALIVAAAYRALELAPVTFSAKFKDVTSKLKVEVNNAQDLSNGVLAQTRIAAIESSLGTSLTEFIDCK